MRRSRRCADSGKKRRAYPPGGNRREIPPFCRVPITVGEPIWVKSPETGHLSTEELKGISSGVIQSILVMAGEA